VGDIVMASGSLWAHFTVTRGAVTALNRSEGAIEDIQNFIQTDAAESIRETPVGRWWTFRAKSLVSNTAS